MNSCACFHYTERRIGRFEKHGLQDASGPWSLVGHLQRFFTWDSASEASHDFEYAGSKEIEWILLLEDFLEMCFMSFGLVPGG